MKTILLSQLSPKQLAALRNEIDILKILDHPHICKLYETYTEPGICVRLVLELCEGGELFDRLHARKRFSEQWVAKLVYRMAGVLRYLHENQITHRDLKLENWLFRSKEDDDEIVLIDFGLSHKYRNEEHMHKKVGTSYYVAPEVLRGDYMGVQADMWSLGVIVYMLLGGCAPYDGQDDEEILQNVALAKKPNYETGPWRRVSDNAKSFVQGLLTVDPEKRLTAEMALQHPWVIAQEKQMVKSEVDDDMYRNLAKFAGFSTLKRIAMEVVAFSLSHEEIKKLTDVFESMDSDHNGYVTFGGMKRELNKNFRISDEELRKIFDALDEEHTGKIHVNEFVAATMQFKYHLDETHLRQAFATIDQSNTGYISVNDLKSLLGKHIDDRRALEMIRAAELEDHGGSHKLSFQEFLSFVRKDGESQVDRIVSSTPKASLYRKGNE
jgi:calcium-dependent protein kinase